MVEMAEGLFVMAYDGFSIFVFQALYKVVPRVKELFRMAEIPVREPVTVPKCRDSLGIDAIIATAEDLMDEVAHPGFFLWLVGDVHTEGTVVDDHDVVWGFSGG